MRQSTFRHKMLITFLLIINRASACAKKYDDDLIKSKEKIKLLEDVLESNNKTINMLKDEVKKNNDDIEEKDEIINKRNKEKKEIQGKWQEADSYIKYIHEEFLKEVNKVRNLETSKLATDAVLQALIKMEENNREFFERIMDKVTYISDKQTKMLQNTQATHQETLKVLQNIVSINNEMQTTLEKYNSNQDELLSIIGKMTIDEMELWSMVKSLRSVIATLKEEQRAQIGEILDKQGERTRLLITSVLNLVSQQDIWKQLNNDTLSENLEKLQIVKFAISEGLKIIDNENATLAMDLKFDFENKLDELKEGINWKENQTIGEWVNEPNVRMKITKDLRNKAMQKIKEISLEGLSIENLVIAQKRLKNLENEIKKQDIELEDLMEKKIEIDEMKAEYKMMNVEHSNTIENLKQGNINATLTDDEIQPIRSDVAHAQPLTNPKPTTSYPLSVLEWWPLCGLILIILLCIALTSYKRMTTKNTRDQQLRQRVSLLEQ